MAKIENQLEVSPKQGRKERQARKRRLQAYQKSLSVISGNAKNRK